MVAFFFTEVLHLRRLQITMKLITEIRKNNTFKDMEDIEQRDLLYNGKMLR